MPYNNIM